jgi:hypothetical protein
MSVNIIAASSRLEGIKSLWIRRDKNKEFILAV